MSITFEQIQKANEATKPTDIGKGKEYIEVNQRVKAFRMLFPNGRISTELISLENGVCIFRASAMDEEGNLLGTGTAYEKEGSTFINKTSYIENCETSAVGRALAMCGIGIDASIASKEEVENAKLNQDKPKQEANAQDQAIDEAKAKARVIAYMNNGRWSQEKINSFCAGYGVKNPSELTYENCVSYIEYVEKLGRKI